MASGIATCDCVQSSGALETKQSQRYAACRRHSPFHLLLIGWWAVAEAKAMYCEPLELRRWFSRQAISSA
jgi:hypothetical protein